MRNDIAYIRTCLRDVEKALRNKDFEGLYLMCQEIAATAAEMEYQAKEMK